MATYAIGDIHGCYPELMSLLEKIQFNETSDQLWFVGDLVNRGEYSLEVLRFVKSLGDKQITVLGNHDLHLLAVARGCKRRLSKDTFQAILTAPDREELLNWLQNRKFLYYSPKLNCILVHAGIPPQWTCQQAFNYASELEEIAKGEKCLSLMSNMYNNQPDLWSDDLKAWGRYRYMINAFTRMRYCDDDGRLELEETGPIDATPEDLTPWFKMPVRRCLDIKIIFGHWASLRGQTNMPNIIGLDTGCVYGRELTAYCIEDQRRISVTKL